MVGGKQKKIKPNDNEPEGESSMVDGRAVEALAQLLYDARNPLGIPWSQRLPAVRTPWLAEARAALGKVAETPKAAPKAGKKLTARAKGNSLAAAELAVLEAFKKHGNGARPLSLATLIHEARLEPGFLITTVYAMTRQGLIGELVSFSGFGDLPTFRLLPAGKTLLAERAEVLATPS